MSTTAGRSREDAGGRRLRTHGVCDGGHGALLGVVANRAVPARPSMSGGRLDHPRALRRGRLPPPTPAEASALTRAPAKGYVVPGKGFGPLLPKRELGPQRSAYPLFPKDLRLRVVHGVHRVHGVASAFGESSAPGLKAGPGPFRRHARDGQAQGAPCPALEVPGDCPRRTALRLLDSDRFRLPTLRPSRPHHATTASLHRPRRPCGSPGLLRRRRSSRVLSAPPSSWT
jgi:hypothetical protein